MQSHWANAAPHYRCRFPAEYALANHVEHPLSVNLREDAIIGRIDQWLAREFAPHRMAETIHDLAEAAAQQPIKTSVDDEAGRKIAECDTKLAQYRAALDAGASPATVAAWISETEAERMTYALAMRHSASSPRRMTEAEIKAIVDKLADIAGVLRDADPEDKGEIFRQLGLKLTYYPGRRLVQAKIEPVQYGVFDSVRGAIGAFVVLDFPEATDPAVVYVETLAGDIYLEEGSDVARYTIAFDRLVAAALHPDDSVQMIERLARTLR